PLGRFCCKSLFALVIKISFGCTREFRVKMWGTSSPEDKLAGDLGNVIGAISIDGRQSDFFTAEKLAPGNLGLLQQYRHFSHIAFPTACPLPAKADMRLSGRNRRGQKNTSHFQTEIQERNRIAEPTLRQETPMGSGDGQLCETPCPAQALWAASSEGDHRSLAYAVSGGQALGSGGRDAGRLYEDRHSRPELRWFWSITIYVDPKLGITT